MLMDKKSTLYQLMGMRMNGIMHGITEQDEDYHALLQVVDECSGRLEALHLPAETMKLIDRYVSGYNAIGSRYGMLAYMRVFRLPGTALESGASRKGGAD